MAPPRGKTNPRADRLQAENLRHTRAEHATETAEDYAEAIADLIEVRSEARVVELARRLGVTHVTVNRTLARLQRAGYVRVVPHRPVELTEAGRDLAMASRRRHRVVADFLRRIGVPPRIAEHDAEGIEHHVSPETLATFERILSEGLPPPSPPVT